MARVIICEGRQRSTAAIWIGMWALIRLQPCDVADYGFVAVCDGSAGELAANLARAHDAGGPDG
jgi:hypothetical protein